jgi:hypothetical protein
MLLDIAYMIKSHAGMFGYDLGTEVAGLLAHFLNQHAVLKTSDLLIVRKHIDTINVIFHQKIKDKGHAAGAVLIDSLRMLIDKLG